MTACASEVRTWEPEADETSEALSLVREALEVLRGHGNGEVTFRFVACHGRLTLAEETVSRRRKLARG